MWRTLENIMNLETIVGLVLGVTIVIIIIAYLVNKADKRRRLQQIAANAAKKAEAAANRVAWEKWRKK
jgi:hypothetical protein